REGPAPRTREPSAGEREGATPRKNQRHFEDRLDLKPRTYYYSVAALDAQGQMTGAVHSLELAVERVITAQEAEAMGLVADAGQLSPGDRIKLRAHPLGTDYLGRDLLARLMAGARVSLFIGIAAPLLFIAFGVIYGAAAGFLGGWPDQALMRFSDFVVALPFLLFMILLRVASGVQPGESGITPMVLAMVLLSWPAAARLVRGQILQIREEGYISASRLLGGGAPYLVLRHMIPNTLGVILVTMTFAVPTAIFTEAFLSFIGMGVAPPTPSWGSMCNEGIKTMLTTPHELIFPALFISVTVLAFNLLGDGLRDALDARMRSAE
ncbi:MAG: ABC transporter permease, partial [Gammaproteobacteria bacterium]|nr:ABC transporter permease [Gammaproteobacteria bacterium]